jgi:hypothetical protein
MLSKPPVIHFTSSFEIRFSELRYSTRSPASQTLPSLSRRGIISYIDVLIDRHDNPPIGGDGV